MHTVDDFIQACIHHEPSDQAMAALAARLGLTQAALIDGLAAAMATRYLQGQLDFAVADKVVNRLAGYAIRTDQIQPLMWSVYLAFDAGEYPHHGDAPDTSPDEQHTRPQLIALLAHTHWPQPLT